MSRIRKPNSMSSKSTTPSPLSFELSSLISESAVLATGIISQRDRVAEIRRLESEQESVKSAVEAETLTFSDGSDRLAKIGNDLALLTFTKDKRASALLAAYLNLRDRGLSLKMEILASIEQAEAIIVGDRQLEVSAVLRGWKGAMPVKAAPLSLIEIANACPKIQALQGHRDALSAWRPDRGIAALAAVAGPAIAAVDGVPGKVPVESLYGGISEREHVVLKGWDGKSQSLQTIAEFATPSEAETLFHEIRGKAGWLGLKQVFKFGISNPNNSHSFGNEFFEPDHRENNAAGIDRQHSGDNERFFNEAGAWAKAAA